MEILLKGNTEDVHRIALSSDDLGELIYSVQSSTDDFAEVFKDFESIVSEKYPWNEYFVLLESDNLVNYEICSYITGYFLDDGKGVTSFIPYNYEYPALLQGANVLGACCYAGNPYYDFILNNIYVSAVGSSYDCATEGGPLTCNSYADFVFSRYGTSEIPYCLFYREAKASTFLFYRTQGNKLSILIGEHNNLPANYSLKIYKKQLEADATGGL